MPYCMGPFRVLAVDGTVSDIGIASVASTASESSARKLQLSWACSLV